MSDSPHSTRYLSQGAFRVLHHVRRSERGRECKKIEWHWADLLKEYCAILCHVAPNTRPWPNCGSKLPAKPFKPKSGTESGAWHGLLVQICKHWCSIKRGLHMRPQNNSSSDNNYIILESYSLMLKFCWCVLCDNLRYSMCGIRTHWVSQGIPGSPGSTQCKVRKFGQSPTKNWQV